MIDDVSSMIDRGEYVAISLLLIGLAQLRPSGVNSLRRCCVHTADPVHDMYQIKVVKR